MAKFDLKEFARPAAQARVAELNDELAAIFRVYPELNGSGRRGRPRKDAGTAPPAATTAKRTRKRPAMTAAQRKAVGLRMKKYWAERRKEKAAK